MWLEGAFDAWPKTGPAQVHVRQRATKTRRPQVDIGTLQVAWFPNKAKLNGLAICDDQTRTHGCGTLGTLLLTYPNSSEAGDNWVHLSLPHDEADYLKSVSASAGLRHSAQLLK